MNPSSTHPVLETGLTWLLNHSVQTGILVLLVLAVQWLFRRRLTPRWRFALWWIVLARLLLPFTPESTVSLFNLVRPDVTLAGQLPLSAPPATHSGNQLISPAPSSALPVQNLPAPEKFAQPKDDLRLLPVKTFAASPAGTEIVTTAAAPVTPPVFRFGFGNFRAWIIPGLSGLWLSGVLIFGGVVTGQSVRFHWKLTRQSAPADRNLQTLFDECRREFPVARRITLLETNVVHSPALYGFFQLRLLLPRGLGSQFENHELRYIFLHELAHVKRGDLWLNWLVTVLQIIHWFNPLVWLGFARLRADRELACDELALLRAGDQAGTAYGETIVKLLEKLNQPGAIPGLVGILEDRKQMRRRIAMIANFSRPGRWSVLAALLIAALAAVALTDAQSTNPADQRIPSAVGGNVTPPNDLSSSRENSANVISTNTVGRPDLTGEVLDEAGQPLPVPATVFIATAAPKVGSSTFCPSCYADCIKRATTDASGHFKIESLDPQLKFQILAVAKGFAPEYVGHVDPAKGPQKIELKPIASADAAPDRSLRGRVVNPQGTPVAGAVVEMRGIETADGGGSWGSLPAIDPLAVTDDNGDFLITAKKPFATMDVKISARTFANKNFSKLASGATPHELTLTEGATLTGRVMFAGQPLAGVSVGISAVDRSTPNYLGHFEIGTDEAGRFTFINLPPAGDFEIYTLMDSVKKFGAAPPQQIRTGNDGQSTDTGDLIVAAAHRLAGRVELADGQPLPPKTRLLISRGGAWDTLQVSPGKDGRFQTTGIPSELINLSVRVKGYRISARNLSLDQLNPYQLIGRVDTDITNLVLVLEKGPDIRPDYSHIPQDYNDSRQHPLRGAEGVPDHSQEWFVSGHVLDAQTKQPLQNFRITPGNAGNFSDADWNTFDTVVGTNGAYQIYVRWKVSQPMLLAEADGYLPAAATLLPGNTTNVNFVLNRGNGSAGNVVTPDGKPAAGVTLVLLNNSYNQARLDSAGELTADWNKAISRQTDAAGKFSFAPVWSVKTLIAASSNGFVATSLDAFATNSTLVLQPYGKISGTLTRPSGPGTNEDLDIKFDDSEPVGMNYLNMSFHAVTDAQGRFSFDRVPPGHLQITYRVPMGNNGWQTPLLQAVDLKPGQILMTNIAAAARITQNAENSWQPPLLKLVPGEQVKGIVLLPGGQPAANADVVLQVENEYLALGKAVFNSNNGRERGFIVSTGPDGSFTLPMYEKAQSVIALNDTGIVQVSLEQLKASPQITLQKWGRIEGVLRVGHHLGTNEQINIGAAFQGGSLLTNSALPLRLPFYDSYAFQARTDDQGHYAIAFVPPGKQVLSRLVPTSNHSWTSSQLATINVNAGETVVTNIGGTGRTVTGIVKIADGSTIDFTNGYAHISTPTYFIQQQAKKLKTEAERRAFYASPAVQNAYENHRGFSGILMTDGTFRMEDVLPGTYEFGFQQRFMPDANRTSIAMFTSTNEITIPAAKDQNDDSTVNLGTIELEKIEIPLPKKDPGGK